MDSCEKFRREVQENLRHLRRPVPLPTTIATPRVGDTLVVAKQNHITALICQATATIACLAEGDVVRLWSHRPRFRRQWKLRPEKPTEARVGVDHKKRECFFLENGMTLPISEVSHSTTIRVDALVPRGGPHHDQEVGRSEHNTGTHRTCDAPTPQGELELMAT